MTKRVLIPFRHERKLQPYMDAMIAGGVEPVPADVEQPVGLDAVSGLLLMGGSDVNPQRYGAALHPRTDAPDDQRDRVELELIDCAIKRDMPILAICRGLQILNVYCGGTLIQHLETEIPHDPETEDKSAPVHDVEFTGGSLLRSIAGVGRWKVNSRHHQAVDRIGEGLEVTGHSAEDGTVEGLERKENRFVVAVQWHPEDQVLEWPEQLRLFKGLAEAL